MQTEIEKEKEAGLGLPVAVTNDVAQQAMMSTVPQQPIHPTDLEHQQDMAKKDFDNKVQLAKLKPKTSVKKEEAEEPNTFERLKRIL